MTARRFFLSIGVTIITTVLVALLNRPIASVEDQITILKYELRGARQADTNIVIVYIDSDAIETLGWPIRRNFYALMVRALTDLGVKAIGIHAYFAHPVPEYPEYDDLLANVVASAGNVVLPSNFGFIARIDTVGEGKSPEVHTQYFVGKELRLPLAKLRMPAAGIGHENFTDENDVPVFIRAGDSLVPSFGAEILRVFAGEHFMHSQNVVRLNFPGRMSSFATYPFLEVLKSYDAYQADGVTSVPVTHLKDKLVLVGVIADGYSKFFNTPVDPRFPGTSLHAVFLDNSLRAGFLSVADDWFVYSLCVALGVLCAAVILFLPASFNKVVAFGLLILVVIASFSVFVSAAYLLPVSPLVMVGLVSSISTLFYRHRITSEQVGILQEEKESILVQLHDKEAKLAVLERELLDVETRRSNDRTDELLEEIRRYKDEIRALSSKADDMIEYQPSEGETDALVTEFEGIVYEKNGKMRPVIDFVKKITNNDAPVLILGESGTGKELIARAIHTRSDRGSGPLVALNCGALSENLLESELFGHEKGAFTGAVKEKAGRFEIANGGTIFLDEIGEVSERFQVKLLRVLQEAEFERVGGTRTMRVNVRVLAATNKDLREQVNIKQFREDLYYRLNVLTVVLPPLRERRQDIGILTNHFLAREDGNMCVSKNVMEALRGYSWRGNIRELESVMKRAVLLARADGRQMISMKDLTEEISATLHGVVPIEDQILGSLREKAFSRSSISDTAEELGGLNRGTVAEYLRGQCFQAFTEQGFDLEKAVKQISLSSDDAVNDRVRKKMREYLTNISEAIDTSQPWEVVKASLKPKTKNLPQRYHTCLVQVAEAYFKNLWRTAGNPST
ncbi:MAG: sigma 54-interacting transcriptional regulator [Ignavibacteria bacterium]|nr:sigma 54-interacting transcriptional regulator [Ignavibacteria bacterium]